MHPRRPSTSDSTTMSHSNNLKHELKRIVRSINNNIVPINSNEPNLSHRSHMMSRQSRIMNEAGHISVQFANDEGVKEMDKIINVINSDPNGTISDDRY